MLENARRPGYASNDDNKPVSTSFYWPSTFPEHHTILTAIEKP